ncbi:MAG: MGMT family protein [Candidatus Woesearchaeota archaeon]
MKQKCYQLLKKVPKGKITTYKQLAKALNTKAYRAVGLYMKQNHDPKIPCHRVVKSTGEIGEYNKGKNQKINLLQKEGIKIKNQKIQEFKQHLFKFNNTDFLPHKK